MDNGQKQVQDKVEELDRMALALLLEKQARVGAELRRIEAERANLVLAEGQLKHITVQLNLEHQALAFNLQAKYGLGSDDEVDVQTGTIKRLQMPPPLVSDGLEAQAAPPV